MIKLEDYHKNLWKCRDFELQHLWQRSVFLTAFMLLTFTGYGTLLIKMIELATSGYGADIFNTAEPYYKTAELKSVGDNKDYLFLMNFLAQGICIVGMIFSILWIMMAKGSKAWYEVYEKAIRAFEKSVGIQSSVKPLKDIDIAGFRYDQIPDIDPIGIDNHVLSTEGGEYSPSKINIAIGIATLWIWIILIFAHVGLAFYEFDLSSIPFMYLSFCMPLFAVVILTIVYIFAWQNRGLKSGALESYK